MRDTQEVFRHGVDGSMRGRGLRNTVEGFNGQRGRPLVLGWVFRYKSPLETGEKSGQSMRLVKKCEFSENIVNFVKEEFAPLQNTLFFP